jgi:hypothetical protein
MDCVQEGVEGRVRKRDGNVFVFVCEGIEMEGEENLRRKDRVEKRRKGRNKNKKCTLIF